MSYSLGPYPAETGYDAAAAADAADELASMRDLFVTYDPDVIYLDGNSLGRLPQATSSHLAHVISEEWGHDLIASWGNRWWALARHTGDLLAPLIGASTGSVVVADSTSISLFKLAWAALNHTPDRNRLVTDDLNFPTDVFVLRSAADAAGGRRVVVIPSSDGICAPEDDIIAALDGETALLCLSHVAFKSGYLYDMARLTTAAHEVGALVLWDLSHSAGVVPTDLSTVDLAVGCTYKYLNGGPGSPAFIYVNPALQIDNPVPGWWGHADPFAFDLEFTAADGIGRFQTGTMPILSLAAIEPALGIVQQAGVSGLRSKSIAQTEYLIDLCDQVLAPLGFTVASPRRAAQRGSHVALRHPDAWRVAQAMIHDARVIPDFREPDNIRLGVAPLYVSFRELHTAVHRIAGLFAADLMDKYPVTRSTVT